MEVKAAARQHAYSGVIHGSVYNSHEPFGHMPILTKTKGPEFLGNTLNAKVSTIHVHAPLVDNCAMAFAVSRSRSLENNVRVAMY